VSAEAPKSKSRLLKAMIRRPELGALSGFLLVAAIFGLATAFGYENKAMFEPLGIVNWLSVSAYLGSIAIGACLLMIAGEFDLSIGSMIGFSGMTMALLVVDARLPASAAIIVGMAIAVSIGALIGFLVVRTGLPSFIVSLSFFFILRGATLVIARAVHGSTQVGGVGDEKASDFLAWLVGGNALHFLFVWLAQVGLVHTLGNGEPAVAGIPMIVVGWIALGSVSSFVLTRTRFGSWIFATGGDRTAAKSAGIPVDRVRIQLFMFTAFCAALFGAAQIFQFGSADGNRGEAKEFEAILATVIGGAILTGGYGSVVGCMVGAMLFAAVSQGFFYTTFLDGDFFRIFVGGLLLASVIFNDQLRKQIMAGR
jgi:simple sugar transport system permease protein